MRILLVGLLPALVFACSDDNDGPAGAAPFMPGNILDQGVGMDGETPSTIGDNPDAQVSQPSDMSSPPNDAMTEQLPPDPMVNSGWIGGPCASDGDCAFPDGYCLSESEGFPRGMCTQACSGLCPDRDGMPVTFCASDVVNAGTCVQRCDSNYFPEGGCRPGYTCESRDRAGEPPNNLGVCVPGTTPVSMTPPDPSLNQSCLNTLTELGLNYTVSSSPDDSPADRPDLTCRLDTPILVHSPVGGIDFHYLDQAETGPVFVTCYFARALLRLTELLEEFDVVRVGHIGTYNCRVIAGTDTLSEHGNANAIDLKWFETSDGTRYDVEDHWEHGVTSGFSTAQGQWLYNFSREMYNRRIFNIILTPEFNSAHDNHFHVDMTPGARFIESNGGGHYMGPNVHGD